MSAHGALNSVQLAMEHSRLTRTPMLIAPKDATGCFDLMRPELVKLIQDSKGVPTNTTKATTMILSKMARYVRTDHGTSTQYIQKTSDNNIGGIGQGAGNGPQGSNCQTGLLKTIHGKTCPGMNITHPLQTNSFRIFGPGFIDNQIDTATLPSQKLTENTQLITHILQSWQDLLNATGGDLSLEKCSYGILSYDFTPTRFGNNNVSMHTATTNPGEISLQPLNQRQLPKTLKRLDPLTPEKYLGVHINMEGTWKSEFGRRKTQFKEIAQKIRTAKMTRLDAYLIYQVRYKKALTYFLHHTHLSTTQCDEIQRPFILAILPKMGFNRFMKRAVIFGPEKFGGMALADAKIEQAVSIIADMMVEIQRATIVGAQYTNLIATYQQYLGIDTPFFLSDPSNFPYKPKNSRITFIWQSLYHSQATVQGESWWLPKSTLT